VNLLEACCKAGAFSLALSLLRGARAAELTEALDELAEVHGDLCVVGGERWLA
jgi:hypothetical protein